MPIIYQNIKKYIWLFIFLALCFSIIFWLILPKPIRVQLAEVKYGTYSEYIEDDAKTRAIKIYTITAPVMGKLLRINYFEGDGVRKNDILATFLPATPSLLDVRAKDELEQELGAAEARYEEAKAILEQAKSALDTALSDFNRKKGLVAKGYVSPSEMEHTELEYKLKQKMVNAAERKVHSAQHDIEKIKASLAATSSNQNYSQEQINILAPISGKILRINQKSETTLNVGADIMELADVSKLEIVADVLSTDAAQIPDKAKVLIKRWGGTVDLKGTVRTVEPSGYTKISALGVEEQRVNVIIDINSPYEQWKNLGDEFRVDVYIFIYESKKELLVPMSALFRDAEHWAVFVVENGRAMKRIVEIKRHNPDNAIVAKGLKEGEKVVLYPGNLISNGVKIKE
ncbi:efflux RND transporter periplasmic adaptor subunit [Legionella parisiensis]|uniref:Macrolide export protein MacA n=1 Tax=Legionella parisiensis TaxID=45071 RepID=A0A1E5JM50_9GAMM|nr:efflux RND transporter periplasmic adaptor subunit [Legionella parisiensis]KTD43035.1 membrane fusion protein [Legionella parisiensis]OEH45108.1 Macrolide export protein MacA [Legionella parisiensis]STX77890.1 HlyD family secretion protein [Legionella parisiensis]